MNKKVKILISVLMLVVLMAALAVNSFAAVKCVNRGHNWGGYSIDYKISYPKTRYAQHLRVENVGTTKITICTSVGYYRDIDPGCSYEICFGGPVYKDRLLNGFSVNLTVQNRNAGKFAYNIKTSSGTIK